MSKLGPHVKPWHGSAAGNDFHALRFSTQTRGDVSAHANADDAVECLYPTLEDGDQYFPAYIERKIVVNGDTPCYDVYFSQDKTKVVEQEESRIRATTETGLLSYNREKFVGQEVILDGLAGRRYKGKYYIEALGLGGTLLNFKLLNFMSLEIRETPNQFPLRQKKTPNQLSLLIRKTPKNQLPLLQTRKTPQNQLPLLIIRKTPQNQFHLHQKKTP